MFALRRLRRRAVGSTLALRCLPQPRIAPGPPCRPTSPAGATASPCASREARGRPARAWAGGAVELIGGGRSSRGAAAAGGLCGSTSCWRASRPRTCPPASTIRRPGRGGAVGGGTRPGRSGLARLRAAGRATSRPGGGRRWCCRRATTTGGRRTRSSARSPAGSRATRSRCRCRPGWRSPARSWPTRSRASTAMRAGSRSLAGRRTAWWRRSHADHGVAGRVKARARSLTEHSRSSGNLPEPGSGAAASREPERRRGADGGGGYSWLRRRSGWAGRHASRERLNIPPCTLSVVRLYERAGVGKRDACRGGDVALTPTEPCGPRPTWLHIPISQREPRPNRGGTLGMMRGAFGREATGIRL